MDQGNKISPDTATPSQSPKPIVVVDRPRDRLSIKDLIEQIDPNQMMTGAAWKLDENGKAVPVNMSGVTTEEGRSMIRQYVRMKMIEDGTLAGDDLSFIDSEQVVSDAEMERALSGLKEFMNEVKESTDPTKDMFDRMKDFCNDRKIDFITVDSMSEITGQANEPFVIPLSFPYSKEGGVASVLKQRTDTNAPFKVSADLSGKIIDEDK